MVKGERSAIRDAYFVFVLGGVDVELVFDRVAAAVLQSNRR